MSEEAWQILAIYFDGQGLQGARRSIAGWTMRKLLHTDESIDAVRVLHGSELTQSKWERALRELVDLGLIEENPDLGERWRIVVKQPKPETPPVVKKPSLKDYWKGN